MNGNETDIGGNQRSFQPTVWTDILCVQEGSDNAAIDRLINAYWKPVYFHIRRKGHHVEDAKDLTQQFFLSFMERQAIKHVNSSKGKFRTYVLSVLDHFLCDEYDRRNAKKRKPNFDFMKAETQFLVDNSFEKDWALTVLENAFLKLKEKSPREAQVAESQRRGITKFNVLAEEIGVSEENIKVIAHRARKHLRQLLLDELRLTAENPGDEEKELKELFKAFTL